MAAARYGTAQGRAVPPKSGISGFPTLSGSDRASRRKHSHSSQYPRSDKDRTLSPGGHDERPRTRTVANSITNDGRIGTTLPWSEAQQRIADARYYWLATVHSSGRPHVRPVLAVWVGDALCTTSNPAAREGRNLDYDSNCSIAVSADDMHIVLEGTASKVVESAVLERIAEAYRSKYDWPVTVVDGAFDTPLRRAYGRSASVSAVSDPTGDRVRTCQRQRSRSC